MKTSIFSQEQLNKLVADSIIPMTLPEGHTNAIVAAVDQNGVKVVAGFTLGEDGHWMVKGAYEHDWSGDNKVGGEVVYSW